MLQCRDTLLDHLLSGTNDQTSVGPFYIQNLDSMITEKS